MSRQGRDTTSRSVRSIRSALDSKRPAIWKPNIELFKRLPSEADLPTLYGGLHGGRDMKIGADNDTSNPIFVLKG